MHETLRVIITTSPPPSVAHLRQIRSKNLKSRPLAFCITVAVHKKGKFFIPLIGSGGKKEVGRYLGR